MDYAGQVVILDGVCSSPFSIKNLSLRACMRFVHHFIAEFSIWTREAGAGGLSIAMEGPSRAEISFEDRKDGSCGVSYVAQEPGV